MIGEITEGFAGELGFVITNSTDKVIVEIAIAIVARGSRLYKTFLFENVKNLERSDIFFLNSANRIERKKLRIRGVVATRVIRNIKLVSGDGEQQVSRLLCNFLVPSR